MSNILVSVVIPTFNRKEQLARLINSLYQSDYGNIEIIVVDDASTDETSSYISSKFPNVKVIRHQKEMLLAASRNSGIRASRGEYFFVIDDDNVVENNTITQLISVMESDKTIGVCAPMMLYFSDPEIIWCAGIKRNRFTSKTSYLHAGERHSELQLPNLIESEDFPNALMIRRQLVEKIGYFDDKNFPINYDEADFCMRAKLQGYRVLCCTSAKIWHDVPSPRMAGKNIGHKLRILNITRTYFLSYNRVLFHRRYNNTLEFGIFLIFLPIFMLHSAFTIVSSSASGDSKMRALRAIFEGTLHAFFGQRPQP